MFYLKLTNFRIKKEIKCQSSHLPEPYVLENNFILYVIFFTYLHICRSMQKSITCIDTLVTGPVLHLVPTVESLKGKWERTSAEEFPLVTRLK